ncbi:MAG: hypothetical protein HYX67_15965 [Candidatus Melainabacteria bacterium]|nr:hypothetical protein [Candidatus Melainabacteria bacterium]
MWKNDLSWESAEKEWDKGSEDCRKSHPIKTLNTLPRMPGITDKGLKWKSIKYILAEDKGNVFVRYFFKHPIKYAIRWIKSALKKQSYQRSGDFFLYGVDSVEQFQDLLKQDNTLFAIGFSYCHKPFECPSGRFTAECIHDPENPVCRQCFIGKTVNALPAGNIRPLFIPTIHYIGEKMFELTEQNPDKQILFLITACEMTLEMFGDWGNMVGAKGIGVRLDGRICNTMKAFELSEHGVKPGLTVVLPETQERMLSLIKSLWPVEKA